MIPTYNCARFLEQALLSVLAQDPGEELMQVEVVDDFSTKDDPEEVVTRIGKGRVKFYRQPANVGVSKNFNTCVSRARGELVHILHGDDWVKDGIYAEVSKAFDNYPDLGIAITGCTDYDAESRFKYDPPSIPSLRSPSSNVEALVHENPIRPPGVVVRKKVYDTIGHFDETLVHCADWDMWVRAVHHFGGLYIPINLGCYRVFPGNDTSRLVLTGENIRDYGRLYAKFQKSGYPVDDHIISATLKQLFVQQYKQVQQLKHRPGISSYKKEMPRYLTAAEIAALKQEARTGQWQTRFSKGKQFLTGSSSFGRRVAGKIIRTLAGVLHRPTH